MLKYILKISLTILLVLLLTSCKNNSIINQTQDESHSITTSENNTISEKPIKEKPSLPFSKNIVPSDITCVDIDDFYSIHALSEDILLIHAGNSKDKIQYLLSYVIETGENYHITELVDSILYTSISNKDVITVMTYSEILAINNNNVEFRINLSPNQSYDYTYDLSSNTLCYIDEDSNLVLENLNSGQIEIIYRAIYSKTENTRFPAIDSEGNKVIERAARPSFFSNGEQIAFVKIGENDYSSLFVYTVDSKEITEYPINIWLYSYDYKSLGKTLIISNYEDVPKSISIFQENKLVDYRLDIEYKTSYSSPNDLLLGGSEQALVLIDLNDFSANEVYNPQGMYLISDATSTKNYISILLSDEKSNCSIAVVCK